MAASASKRAGGTDACSVLAVVVVGSWPKSPATAESIARTMMEASGEGEALDDEVTSWWAAATASGLERALSA